MDVCILAGGKGTRLAGVWDGPKCLVPVGGKPLLELIIHKTILELETIPKNIVISVGSQTKGLDVVDWWLNRKWVWGGVDFHFAMEPAPLGRLRALLYCLPALTPPILVLNGDTLPRYSFQELGTDSAVAMYQGKPAGAYVLSEDLIGDALGGYCGPTDNLDDLLLCFIERHVGVPGFLDVGTPAGFAEAQQLTTTEG